MEKIDSITLETTNACNIQCAICPIPQLRRKKGMLTFEDFKIILSKLPSSIKQLRMNYSGEPLLNENTFKMVRYAKEQRPDIHIRISTNGTHLEDFSNEEIINSNLDELDICIDGPTKEIHEEYRAGSNFDQIISSSRKLCDYKKKNNAKFPKLIQMTLLNKKTSPLIEDIIKQAAELGFDELQLRYMFIPTLICSFIKLKKLYNYYNSLTDEVLNTFEKRYFAPSKYSLYKKTKKGFLVKQEMKKCFSFVSPLIYYNGDVSVCCHDGEGYAIFGNIIKEDFHSVMKKMPVKEVYNKKLDICRDCDLSWMGVNYKTVKLK
jgi:MoaA/NifB/PqqE/SkfB family radical SAM enzyme